MRLLKPIPKSRLFRIPARNRSRQKPWKAHRPPRVEPSEIGRLINAHERFIVIAHHRPDGDAIGSQLALGDSLRVAGKTVAIVNEDGLPESLAFLDPDGLVQRPSEVDAASLSEAEVVFALDTATRVRLGKTVLSLLPEKATWVVIDHHVSNRGYGDLNLIDSTAPATGEILFRLIQELELPLTPTGRNALYAAISTDTGSFRYPATTSRTLGIASQLVAGGIDVGGNLECPLRLLPTQAPPPAA